MTTLSFSAQVDAWIRKVRDAEEAVFKQSAQAVIERAQQLLTEMVYDQPPAPSGYRRTGYLLSSLTASTSAMPSINPGAIPDPNGVYTYNRAEIEAVIAGSQVGQTVFAGYTAAYSGYVHYGARGQSPRPWVELAAQQWPAIVDGTVASLKQRLGL